MMNFLHFGLELGDGFPKNHFHCGITSISMLNSLKLVSETNA